MYVRKKPNPSGVVSIQVIDKSSGKYKLLKTIGSSSNSFEISRLESEANQWIKSRIRQIEIDFTDERNLAKQFLDSIEQITVQGTELLLGRIFDEIGFAAIPDMSFMMLLRCILKLTMKMNYAKQGSAKKANTKTRKSFWDCWSV